MAEDTENGEEVQTKVNPIMVEQAQDTEAKDRKTARQIATIDQIVSIADELGLKDKVFLWGGYTHEATAKREHSDLDLIVQGEQALNTLQSKLIESGQFEHTSNPETGQFSRADMDTTDPISENKVHIDMLWVEPAELNGVAVWQMRTPDVVQKALGKPLAIPDSAFSSSQEKVSPGQQELRYMYPEYSFLVKQNSTKPKDIADRIALADKLDSERLKRIQEDTIKADVTFTITPQALEALKSERTSRLDK